MPSDILQKMRKWVGGQAFKKPDPLKYQAVPDGFHPYQEEDGKFMLVNQECPVRSDKTDTKGSWQEEGSADIPGWSAILSLYPDLTHDPSFDKRKLGTWPSNNIELQSSFL